MELQHYGVKGMKWGKTKKSNLATGFMNNPLSSSVSNASVGVAAINRSNRAAQEKKVADYRSKINSYKTANYTNHGASAVNKILKSGVLTGTTFSSAMKNLTNKTSASSAAKGLFKGSMNPKKSSGKSSTKKKTGSAMVKSFANTSLSKTMSSATRASLSSKKKKR